MAPASLPSSQRSQRPSDLQLRQRPDFPTPIGVFRAVEKPTYEALLEEQVSTAQAQRGAGDLAELLHSGDTWTVEQ